MQKTERRTRKKTVLSRILYHVLLIGTFYFIVFSRPGCSHFPSYFGLTGKPMTHDKRVILSNGVTMPVLAAGTWQFTSKVAEKSVYDSLEAGYRHIDTAFNYFNQDGVGRGITRFLQNHPDLSRYDIFVTTKVPACGTHGLSFENCGDDTHATVQKNLDLLGFNHVDMILIHFPPKLGGCGGDSCEAVRHQYKALQHAFITKKTRSIGVSNFCQECIDCIMSWPELYILPVINQIEFHIGMGTDPDGIISYSESQGITVQAYSPLGDNTQELISGADLSPIARKHGKTVPQVSLKWVLQNNVTLVSKSTKSSHMRQNLDLFSWSLDKEDVKYLNSKTEPKGYPLC